jgi:hypothetical protein
MHATEGQRISYGLTSVPVWLVAILAAAAAPSCVRLYADALEKRVRARTQRMLAAALPSEEEAEPSSAGTEHVS